MTDDTAVTLDLYAALRDAPETATDDYLRCEVGGLSLRERAKDRGVAAATVHANVERARRYIDA